MSCPPPPHPGAVDAFAPLLHAAVQATPAAPAPGTTHAEAAVVAWARGIHASVSDPQAPLGAPGLDALHHIRARHDPGERLPLSNANVVATFELVTAVDPATGVGTPLASDLFALVMQSPLPL